MVENWIQTHYIAPALCLYTLLLLQGVRHLRAVHVGKVAIGRRAVRVLPALCLLMLGLRVFAFPENTVEEFAHMRPNWAYSTWRLHEREQVESRLHAVPGQHLVIVRYRAAFHNVHRELVYNLADFPTSKILWARSADPAQNCALVQVYGRTRSIWVVDNWGYVYKLLPESPGQICDPRNPIYEVNEPREFYTHPGRFLRQVRKPSPPLATSVVGSSHVPSSTKATRALQGYSRTDAAATESSEQR